MNNIEYIFDELKKLYGEDIVNNCYDELDSQYKFSTPVHGILILYNTLAIRYNKSFNPTSDISERYKLNNIDNVLTSLKNGDDNLLLSHVNANYTIGDLKDMITDAMIKQRMFLQEDKTKPLEDWQIYDTKKWYFNDWLNSYKK